MLQSGMAGTAGKRSSAIGRVHRLPLARLADGCLCPVFSAFLDYLLEDGSKIHVEQQPAWCRACARSCLRNWSNLLKIWSGRLLGCSPG